MKPHQASLEISYDGGEVKAAAKGSGGASDGPSAGSGSQTYTVVRGDNLWGIAKRFYGSGARYLEIYNANKNVIEAAARAHGKQDSYKGSTAGWWLWPGEILVIPGTAGDSAGQAAGKSSRDATEPKLGAKIAGQTTAFSYTDVASGQSDSVSITLADIGKEWLGRLMPKRGASLGVRIVCTNWGSSEKKESFDCGTFVIDDISFSGRPLSCVLGGVSVPAMDDFKSLPVTNTWEKTTIREIASQIAAKAGVSLYYDADTIKIAEIEQSRQTNSAFLYTLCEKYGLAMKVYNRKIVIFDIVTYEARQAVFTLRETDMLSWSFNTTVDGTYTGVNLDYTDPDTEKTIKVTMGRPGRMYAVNTQASGKYDAELQAAATVNAANRGMQTMEVTIRADRRIVASHCIMIAGLGSLDGKYYVDKVRHSLGNGYTMQLSIHKVQMPVGSVSVSSAGSGGQIYTVVKGDNLWSIAKRFYGSGVRYMEIYNANADVIEAEAKAHGKTSSYKGSMAGWWLWAGERLVIP